LNNDGNIKFTLAEQGSVNIAIYNLQGKMIKRINLNNTVAGNHNLSFNASEFAAGTYLMTFTSGDHREVKKFIKK
jgi:5-hydroxyisourate hydrolase-like protein (transthyretin family)